VLDAVIDWSDLEALDSRLLAALVEGFRARAGAKERHQAMSEYEIARRAGVQEYSYVQYEESSERSAVRSALARLQRRGLARSVAVSGRYETFVPAEAALVQAEPELPAPEPPTPDLPALEAQPSPVASPPPSVAAEASPPMPTTFEGRLDEMIRLLRSIDERLNRIERG
jgi:hypothetical protein